MGHHNALEFLRVDFVYPTGSLFCDLSRHAVYKDALRDGPLEKLWRGGEFLSRRNFFSLSNPLYEFFLGRSMNIF